MYGIFQDLIAYSVQSDLDLRRPQKLLMPPAPAKVLYQQVGCKHKKKQTEAHVGS